MIRNNIDEEIDICHNKMDMSWDEIGQCFIRGAQAAFIDDPKEKQKLIDTVTRRVAVWVGKQKKLSAEKAHSEQLRKGMIKSIITAAWVAAAGCIAYGNMKY